MENLKDQLVAMQPNIEIMFASNVARMFGLITMRRTNTFNVRRMLYDRDYPTLMAIRHMLDESDNADGTKTFALNADKVALHGKRYAEETSMMWYEKICNKLVELDDAIVTKADIHEVRIYGNRNGKRIQMEQHIIINSSSKGKLFNQFPCRIYVDGKFTSEAKYKQM
jgi:hypothetical protein